ncbi:CYTH domain-containing protein [Halomonas halocynthiae]|uniref:CYTH domain-containing protein n=1 Tax=Halomonas halocynthiae TaxID=176290 RepID=UPI000422EDD5|nr:CYTH domain-containing protein [Halomonas halocynthiae]
MADEIELKLALAKEAVARVSSHSLLAKTEAVCQQLRNTYFDTPDGILEANGSALRIRHDGKRYIQTLKTRGHSEGGLSRRGEWEWQLAAPELNLNALAELPVMASLGTSQLSQLGAIFTTDFQRNTWRLDTPESQIEVALDQGEIHTGSTAHRVTICELELELKSGSANALLDIADTLAQHIPLRPSDTSKAARGNFLRGHPWQLPPHSAPLQRALVALDALNDTEQLHWLAHARQSLGTLAESTDQYVRQPASMLLERIDPASPPLPWDLHCGQLALRLVRQIAGQRHNCHTHQG